MRLAKPRLDIGLATNDLAPMLAFWHGEAGIPFDHLLPIRKGLTQHRHDIAHAIFSDLLKVFILVEHVVHHASIHYSLAGLDVEQRSQ